MLEGKKAKTKEEVIAELEELTKQIGFIYSFSLLITRDFFYDPEEVADVNWQSKMLYQEASFLAGLMIKHTISLELPSPDLVEVQIDSIDKLLLDLHKAHVFPVMDEIFKTDEWENKTDIEKEEAYRDYFGKGDQITEPIFYGGSGAYDFQYLDVAQKRYRYDNEWLKKNKNVSIDSLGKITMYLKTLLQQKKIKMQFPKSLTQPSDFEEMYKSILDLFTFSKNDLSQFNKNEINSLLDNFISEPGSANQELKNLGDYNEVISHPIIKLAEDRYFLPIAFNLPQSIYESPFYWMGKDTTYSSTAFANQGVVAEEIAAETLENVFGKKNVYRNILIKKGRNRVTDIDVLAVIGNKAIVAQVKSQKLTKPSRNGDQEQLKKDFTLAVQGAYEQGLIARSSILNKENILEYNGRQIQLDESIDEVYILCVSLDHYPAVTSQVDVYLNKKEEDPVPIAVSVFDLELIAFYLKDPFEFLYYVRQRVTLGKYFKAMSEAVFLGAHLHQKLEKFEGYDGGALDNSFAQLIDANFPAMKGYVPVTEAVERLHSKWKNDDFDKIVEKIKETGESGFTDAILFLYDLSSESADNLIKNIKIAKNKGKSDGKQHDCSLLLANNKGGISFIYLPNSPEEMEARLMTFAMARKYKAKADVWLALGSCAGSKDFIDAVAFNNQPWKEDLELEEIMNIALTGKGTPMSLKTGKKLGRNEPCYCGNGRKYKKCHGA